MRELERTNPVRPSVTNKPPRSDRLTAAIAGGTSLWVARKQEKSRRRAQEHRLPPRKESPLAQGWMHVCAKLRDGNLESLKSKRAPRLQASPKAQKAKA